MSSISVLVLTYAHEATLEQAIRSIMAQKLSAEVSLDIVVALDKSPDQTLLVAEKLLKLEAHRIKIVTGPTNLGMMGNLRRGLAACTGDFIAFCEGDDYWTSPMKLSRQLDGLVANPGVLVSATRGQKLFPDGRCEFAWKLRDGDGIVPTKSVLAMGGIALPTASLLWRAAALQELPEWLFHAPVADVFLLMAGLRRQGVWYIDLPCVAYRVAHAGSWSETFLRWTYSEQDHYGAGMIESYCAASKSFGIEISDLGSRLARFYRLRCEIALRRRDWYGAMISAKHLPILTILRMIVGYISRLLRIR